MDILKKNSAKSLNLITLWAVCYLAVLIGGLTYYVNREEHKLLYGIDQMLKSAALSLKYMLADDFHDRAIGPLSITKDEEMRNRLKISNFAREGGYAYLYTLVEKDGNFYFSAPSVTEEEAQERESWYYYPYSDIPEAFKRAYYQQKEEYVSYHDQWGDFRSAAIPQRSSSGRLYLACADYDVSSIQRTLKEEYFYFFMTGLMFYVCAIPAFFIYWNARKRYVAKIEVFNRELLEHQEHLDELVSNRTADLKEAHADLSRAHQTLELIIRNLPFGILIIDQGHKIRHTNEATLRMTGYDSEKDLLGKVCFDILCPMAKGKCPIMDLDQEVDRAERIMIRKDGTRFPVLKSAIPIVFEGKNMILEAFVDIEERQKTMQELERAKKAAEDMNRIKDEFLSNVSHEMRTPLNGIIGLAEYILDKGDISKDLRYIQMILNESQVLLRLINDLLDYAKIESGKLEIQRRLFALSPFLESIISPMAVLCAQKGLELKLYRDSNIPEILEGDDFRLLQVMHNLIGNSVKFTEKGQIDVRVLMKSIVRDGKLRVRFEVEDTGIGIPEKHKDYVFRGFAQADGSMTRRYGGTGLGTAISRELVELMGGQIGFKSSEGRGTLFWFEVTLSVASDQKVSSVDFAGDLSTHKWSGSVLVAEDYPVNQESMRLRLEALGARVVIAENGKIAWDIAKTQKFDLILMDLHMPEMDGLEATKKIITESGLNRETPIVGLSADVRHEISGKCADAGMRKLIAKPISQATLLKILNEYLALADPGQNKEAGGIANENDRTGSTRAPMPSAASGNSDVIDIAEALSLFAGNKILLDMSLKKIVESLPSQIANVRTAWDAKDMKVLKDEAHKIRGGSASVAAKRLCEISEKLEHAARDNDQDAVGSFLENFYKACEELLQSLTKSK